MTKNGPFAAALEELADYLEAQEVDYKPQMYRTAAANVRDHSDSLESLVADDRVTEIEGIGESISEKAAEFVEEGEIEALERERQKLPVDMEALTAVEGLGPKRVKALYEALEITDLDSLEEAARAGDIASVDGFGERTQENILAGIDFARQTRERELLGTARPLAEDLLAAVEAAADVADSDAAGSLRRWKETIGDVDILVASGSPAEVVEAFTDLERREEVIEAGTNKASIQVEGIRVDLRVVDPVEYGAALQYFTGSREHNIRLRNEAVDRGYKVNEYGVFDVSDVDDPDAGQRVGERVAGETETSVYDAIGLPYIEPELREDTGELTAAREGRLPDLVTEDELRGDLHIHSDWSDGSIPVAEMAEHAADFGHEYIAITDHAVGPGIFASTGLTDEDVEAQVSQIEDFQTDAPIDVLTGIEVNIDTEGTLAETDDSLLERLDCVVASPHSGLSADTDATERLIDAVEHPVVDILGHPSGRQLNQREGLTFDVEAVATAAGQAGTALEVNANPIRLDLWGTAIQTAVQAGATIAINTDAHSPAEFSNIIYGVHTARRGWAEAADVLNTFSLTDLKQFLR